MIFQYVWGGFWYIGRTHSWAFVTTMGTSLKQNKNMWEINTQTKCPLPHPPPLTGSIYFRLNAVMWQLQGNTLECCLVDCLFRTVTQAYPCVVFLCSSLVMVKNSLTENTISIICHVDRWLKSIFCPKYHNYSAPWLKRYKLHFYFPVLMF